MGPMVSNGPMDPENRSLCRFTQARTQIVACAPKKVVFIRNNKPKKSIQDDSYISKLFDSKTKDKKWQIINDTRNTKKIDWTN